MPRRDYVLQVEVDYTPPGDAPAVEEDQRITIDTDPLQVSRDDDPIVVDTDAITIDRS